MNRNPNDDAMDRILRDVMQSRPEHPPLQGLALRAMQRANETVAARLRPERFRRHSLWQQLVTLAAAAIVGLAVWFAADHIIVQTADDFSASTVTASDQIDLIQAMTSDEMLLIAFGTLLVVALIIAVQRALSSEHCSLVAGGLGDFLGGAWGA